MYNDQIMIALAIPYAFKFFNQHIIMECINDVSVILYCMYQLYEGDYIYISILHSTWTLQPPHDNIC